jgi:hypothetical protein
LVLLSFIMSHEGNTPHDVKRTRVSRMCVICKNEITKNCFRWYPCENCYSHDYCFQSMCLEFLTSQTDTTPPVPQCPTCSDRIEGYSTNLGNGPDHWSGNTYLRQAYSLPPPNFPPMSTSSSTSTGDYCRHPTDPLPLKDDFLRKKNVSETHLALTYFKSDPTNAGSSSGFTFVCVCICVYVWSVLVNRVC